jgi:hypothetical protein
MITDLIKNLPAELQEKIYDYDDTYKPTPKSEIWFDIHMELLAEAHWFKLMREDSD